MPIQKRLATNLLLRVGQNGPPSSNRVNTYIGIRVGSNVSEADAFTPTCIGPWGCEVPAEPARLAHWG